MNISPFVQRREAKARRITVIKQVMRVEGDDHAYQMRRHAIAIMRSVVALYPEDAVKIVRELVPDVVK